MGEPEDFLDGSAADLGVKEFDMGWASICCMTVCIMQVFVGLFAGKKCLERRMETMKRKRKLEERVLKEIEQELDEEEKEILRKRDFSGKDVLQGSELKYSAFKNFGPAPKSGHFWIFQGFTRLETRF